MNKEEDLGFTVHEKNGDFIIFHKNRKATTLRGLKAFEFKDDIENLSFAELQQLMARLTGNYKHGNEKVAKNHLRNKSI